MEALVLIAVVLLFSILDAVGRKQKQEAQRREGQGRVGDASSSSRGPARDEAASAASRERSRAGETRPSSSEGLIPGDIWEEITALARGEVPARRPSAPPAPDTRSTPPPRAPTRVPPRSSRRQAPGPGRRARAPVGADEIRQGAEVTGTTPRRPSPGERIHASHAKMGHDMSERLSRLDRPADHRRHPNPDAGAALRMLRANRSSLRQSLILKEVLGPPVALRGDEGGRGP